MPAVVPILAIASAGATVYSAVQQNKAAKQQAAVDTATADYNAKQDIAAAHQLDLDTLQNVRTARAEDAVYLSRQAASYASAGVLANTGSALHAQITNAGRMEQQIQQEYLNSQQKQQQYSASAAVGRLEGSARASADRTTGRLALLNGGTRLASQAFDAYDSGVFAGLGKTKQLGPKSYISDSPAMTSTTSFA